MTPLDKLISAASAIGILAMLLAGGWFGLHHYGAERYKAGHAAAIAERAAADSVATLRRTEENSALSAVHGAINLKITEAKHEEMQPVRERIVTQRVYVGAAVCGDGPPSATQTKDAASSDSADPPRRLVRPDVERDLVALKLAVEEDLATGRACQKWGADNGFSDQKPHENQQLLDRILAGKNTNEDAQDDHAVR